MVKTKKKIRFFQVTDLEAEQQYLEKQQLAGWQLVHISKLNFYVFEKCVPSKMLYRLDYAGTPKDYLQMFRDFGWEYCGSCNNWNYFRKPVHSCDVESEDGLFSDEESKRLFMQKVLIWHILPSLVLIGLEIYGFINIFIKQKTPIFTDIFNLILFIFFILGIGLLTYRSIRLAYSLYKIRRK